MGSFFDIFFQLWRSLDFFYGTSVAINAICSHTDWAICIFKLANQYHRTHEHSHLEYLSCICRLSHHLCLRSFFYIVFTCRIISCLQWCVFITAGCQATSISIHLRLTSFKYLYWVCYCSFGFVLGWRSKLDDQQSKSVVCHHNRYLSILLRDAILIFFRSFTVLWHLKLAPSFYHFFPLVDRFLLSIFFLFSRRHLDSIRTLFASRLNLNLTLFVCGWWSSILPAIKITVAAQSSLRTLHLHWLHPDIFLHPLYRAIICFPTCPCAAFVTILCLFLISSEVYFSCSSLFVYKFFLRCWWAFESAQQVCR